MLAEEEVAEPGGVNGTSRKKEEKECVQKERGNMGFERGGEWTPICRAC